MDFIYRFFILADLFNIKRISLMNPTSVTRRFFSNHSVGKKKIKGTKCLVINRRGFRGK